MSGLGSTTAKIGRSLYDERRKVTAARRRGEHNLRDHLDTYLDDPPHLSVVQYDAPSRTWVAGTLVSTAATTVVTETAFGQASAVGVLLPYARADHTHGTPANPVPAHEAAGDPHPGYGLIAGTQTWIGGNTFHGTVTVTNVGGYAFIDRNTARAWQWYGNFDLARLYNGTSGDVFTVDASGNLTVPGSMTVGATLVALVNDSRFTDSRNPTGAAGGILAGTYPNPSLAADRVRLAGDTMTGDLIVGSTYPRSVLGSNRLTLEYDASTAMAIEMKAAVSSGVGKGLQIFNPASGLTLARFCESSSFFDVGPALGQTSSPASGKRVNFGVVGTGAIGDQHQVNFVWGSDVGASGGLKTTENSGYRKVKLSSGATIGGGPGYLPGELELTSLTATAAPRVDAWDTLFAGGYNVPALLNKGSALSGSPPAVTAGQFFVQAGTTTLTLDGSGNGTVTFPTAFPGGLLTVLAINGDAGAGPYHYNTAAATSSSFDINAQDPSGASTASLTVRVNWIALGW